MPKPSVCDGMTNTSARSIQRLALVGRRRSRAARRGRRAAAGCARATRSARRPATRGRPARAAARRAAWPAAARRRRAARRGSCAARACRETGCSPSAGSRRAARPGRARRASRSMMRSAARRAGARRRAAVCVEIDDDLVGPPRVRRGERRVVAPDLGARALGMIEEVEVVDGDDLRGASSRQQQRMAATATTSNVLARRAARSAASRAGATRGSGAAPARGGRRSARPGTTSAVEAVLPGRREQRQRLAGGRRCATSARASLVHVFADAGPLAERGSVVEQDPHGRDSADAITRGPARAVRATPCSVNRLTAFLGRMLV